MAKRLLERGDSISLPPANSAAPIATAPVRPKTSIGGLANFMVEESKTQADLDALRIEHAKFEGANPSRRLDPRSIAPSEWANRHEDSFKSEKYVQLREEIRDAGGNVQAIKVRPIPGGVRPSHPPVEYEIVFGHRRHRACLELGIPVNAVIEETSEQRLFVDMDRENRQRADLSAWEQGMMYVKALDRGLFPSNTQLAAAIGRGASDIGKAIALARLPRTVIEAFQSPLDLQFRWATPLNDALLADPDKVVGLAEAVTKNKKSMRSSKEVFQILTGAKPFNPQEINGQTDPSLSTNETKKSQKITIGKPGNTVAVVSVDKKGMAQVRFKIGLAPDRQAALAKLIEDFLA